MAWDISVSLETYLSVSIPVEPATYSLKSSSLILGCSAACFGLALGLGASKICAMGNYRETKSQSEVDSGKSSATHRVLK